MALKLRQICLVAHELAPAIEDLREVFGLNVAFIDPAVGLFGLENTLLGIGRNFLEVVSPVREGTAAGRFLDRRRGDGGYMVICQTSDEATQEACRERAAEAGVRVAWDRVEGTHHYMQLHPRDLKAAFFEIDWEEHGQLEGDWGAANGRAWEEHVCTDIVADFAGVALQSSEPPALARLWADVAGLDVEDADGEPYLQLANARIRFTLDVDGRGPGLSEIDLRMNDRARAVARARARGLACTDDEIEICGTRFRLDQVPERA